MLASRSQAVSLPSHGPQFRSARASSRPVCRSTCVVSAPAVQRSLRRAVNHPLVVCSQGVAHPGEVRFFRCELADHACNATGAQRLLHPYTHQYHMHARIAATTDDLLTFHCIPQEASKGSESRSMIGPFMSVPDVTMAKGGGRDYGSGSALGAVLEKSKLEFVMPTPPQQAPKLDDGGSGGNSGKNIHNGGGGGDGDDGDDDDYFGEGDGDGDGQGGRGDGFFRTALPELYDKLTLNAVLQEWYKTIADLPLFIRRAVEMGLFSSAQLVRFLSMDVRPNVTRSVSRALPSEVGCSTVPSFSQLRASMLWPWSCD